MVEQPGIQLRNSIWLRNYLAFVEEECILIACRPIKAMYLWGYFSLVFHIRFLVSNHRTRVPRLSFLCSWNAGKRKDGRSRGWEDNRRALFTISINMLTVSSDVSIQWRHWQPLSVHLEAVCTHPTHDVNDMWPPGSKSPTLFEQWCGFFYVPQKPDKRKCCETKPTCFRRYPTRLESLTVCRCHYKGRTFFSVILRPWGLVRPGFEPAT